MPGRDLALAAAALAALAFALLSDRWLEASYAQLSVVHRDRLYRWGPDHDVALGLYSMSICPAEAACVDSPLGELPARWHTELVLADVFGDHPHDEWLASELRSKGSALVVRDIVKRYGVDRATAKRIVAAMFAWSPALIPFTRIVLVAIVLALLSLGVTAVLVGTGTRVDLPIAPTTVAVLSLALALITGCVLIAIRPGPPGYLGVGPSFWALGLGVVAGLVAAIRLSPHLHPTTTSWDP